MDSPSTSQASAVTVTASKAAAADTAEFRALFDRECGYVLASLRRLGVQERDCEDLGNEVFVRVYQKLDDLDRSRSARPWLFAFCVRLASDYRGLKRHTVERFSEHDGPEPAAGASPPTQTWGPEADVARSEAREIMARALATLDLDKRAVFVLHEIDETAIPEVARALGMPEGTAYSRLRAARAEVAAAVREMLGKEPR
jgi:RNA polymerase sigma-70 factor (ECF subfamily)